MGLCVIHDLDSMASGWCERINELVAMPGKDGGDGETAVKRALSPGRHPSCINGACHHQGSAC